MKKNTNDEQHQYQRTPYSFGGYFASVKLNIVFVLTDFRFRKLLRQSIAAIDRRDSCFNGSER